MKPFMSAAAAAALLLLAACSLPASDAGDADKTARQQIAAAKAQWQNCLDELPVGADEAQIKDWQARHGLKLDYDAATASYSSTNLPDGRAEVHAKNRICNGYFLVLKLKMDKQNRLQDKKLDALGSCL
ncbi:hypothetical protein [Neisseria bacilliformis]|uniref:hypothetical protein n=1 Tax=Neisseria bacilliformis TaxID=267212 RepID=UPI0006687017|nr:hypothetical protein [Neisseria bacilliformis]